MSTKRRLGLVLVLFSSVSLAWSQADPLLPSGRTAAPAVSDVANVKQPALDDDKLGIPAVNPPGLRLSGEECPEEGFLCGQDHSACGSSQWYFYSDLEFENASDPNQERRVRCEDFPPPGVDNLTAPIGVISWRGVYVDSNANGCTKQHHTFRIRFYADTGSGHNAPADPNVGVYTETLTATAVDTGESVLFYGATIVTRIWSFTAVLTNTVSLGTGWFSICGDGTPGCFHLWEGAGDGEGNSKFYGWWEQGGTIPGPAVTGNCDLNYCFSQKLIGSCCLDCENGGAGECLAPLAKTICQTLNGRFVLNGTCAPGEFTPVCGLGLGACCVDNGNCSLTTCADCGPYPNVWLGAGTQCTACCTVAVPQGAIKENEPPCGPDYNDTFNSGCYCLPPDCCKGDANCDGFIDFNDINAFVEALAGGVPCNFCNCDNNDDGAITFDDINPFVEILLNPPPCATPRGCVPPPFSPIQPMPGHRMYGKSGTYVTGGQHFRDTDWYEYDASAGGPYKKFTFSVRTEFDVQVYVIHSGDCYIDPNNPNDPDTDSWIVTSGGAEPCSGGHPELPDVTVETHCVPSGVYWFVVMPQTSSGVPCGADYWAELEVEDCTPVELACTGYEEIDACGAHTDLGCEGQPPEYGPFEVLPDYVPGVPFTVCGNTFTYRDAAGNYLRDIDWYSFTLHKQATIAYTVETELPIRASVVFGYGSTPLPTDCEDEWYTWAGATFLPGPPTPFDAGVDYPVGTYYFLVAPESAAGALFYGYPCVEPEIEHDYKITFLITDVTCPNICGTSTPEGEPVCGDEYVDTFDGGCDAATFAAKNLSLGTIYCGKAGTFTVGGQPAKDYDWWKVTVTSTNNARLLVALRSETNLVYELYAGIGEPNNPNCAGRVLRDWYRVDACEAQSAIYTPCLAAGTYYLRIYTVESNVPCTEGNEYKLTVSNYQTSCTLCSVVCNGGPDDPCQTDPNQPETNDPCNDPNFPGTAMNYPIGNAPSYGAKQCGRISTFVAQDGGLWVDRDFFQFTMTAGKTTLRIRAKAQFRMAIRLFTPECVPVTDGNLNQRMVAWPMACATAAVQSISNLTNAADTTYYAEIVYGNGLVGAALREWFEGLPCSTNMNNYEIELQQQ